MSDYQLTPDQVEYYTEVVGVDQGVPPARLRRHYYSAVRAHLDHARAYLEEAAEVQALPGWRTAFLWLAVDHFCIALQMREAARLQARRSS